MKLKSKINLITLVYIIISTIFFIIIFLPYQKEFSANMLEKDKVLLKTLVKRDENPIANELFDKSSKAILVRLNEMTKVKGIIGISVFDVAGNMVVNTDIIDGHDHVHHIDQNILQLTTSDNIDYFQIVDLEHHNALRYVHEIHVVGETIGFIQIYYSLDDIENQKEKVLLLFSILMGVIVFSFAFLIHSSIIRIVIRPIVTLRNLMLKVQVGDFDQRMDIHRDDEIGDLADAFNQMSSELNDSYSEIKKQNQQIYDIKLYLKSIIDSMSSMIISVDSELGITEINKSAIEYMKVDYNNCIGQKICDFIPLFMEFREDVIDVLHIEKPISLREKRLNDNFSEYYNVFIYPLMKDGAYGAVILIEDISELHKKDEQLKQAQKMETIGTLAGGIAHDFNNILAGIVGTTSILKFSINKGCVDEKMLGKSIDIIEKSADRASELVKQLLAVSRKQELLLRQISLKKSILNVVNICKNSFDKSIDILTDCAEIDSWVNADPSQIEQVILNICVNASHSMTIMRKDGNWGGKLSISLFKVHADLDFKRLHVDADEIDYWCISITDTGIGIETDIIDKIFDPFFTTKKHGDGTGLGLSMTYRTIVQHKGFIDVISEKDKGSTFNVYLPELKEENPGLQVVENISSELIQGEGTILIVDDEVIVRETAKVILEECGYDVLLAEDGEAGVALFKENKDSINAVLLDLIMPKMHGHDVFNELYKLEPNVKVLMASGFINDSRALKALEMGVKGFIQKPYTLEALSVEINKVINT